MTPKEECEELMNGILPFTINCLEKYGEFFPCGAVMRNDKTITLTASYDGDEKPESKDVIVKLENIHRKLANDGEIIASAIAYDTKINNQIEDAITISLEHKDNYSVKVVFPYKIKKKLFKNKIDFYDTLANEGSNNIFKY